MESSDSNINSSNIECKNCTEEFNRFRSSISQCSHCNSFLCSECLLFHQENLYEIQNQYQELNNKINEKEKYINDTCTESIEIILNWYQRLINDLIESQTQIIENIQNERDRARDELAQFDLNIQQITKSHDKNLIQTKLNELTRKLSNYQITKDVYLPDSYMYQPRYKISYQFQNCSLVEEEEEDWDIETNEKPNTPFPSSHLTTTTPLFLSNSSQTFITPKDDDDDDFEWTEDIEEVNDNNCEYFLDPKLYHLGTSRYFNYNIHLIASNGNDLLLVNYS